MEDTVWMAHIIRAVFLDDEIPELKNITFNYPEDYIPILDEEIGVSNTITIEML